MLRTILIVDDSSANRQALCHIIQDQYTILEADNGEEALQSLRLYAADIALVVLDIAMPAMAGFELLEAIRADSSIAKIPVIVSTDSEADDAELKALKLGAVECIARPFNPDAVKQRINNIIRLVEMARDMDALRVSEERYRIAASAGGRVTARYDIQTGTYYRGDESLTKMEYGSAIENVPQTFIDHGVIAPESVDACHAFFEQFRSGVRTCAATLSLQVAQNAYRWFRCDATIICDVRRRPAQAIIVYTDITEQREKEAVYLKWQQSLQQKSPENYTLFHCNLSQDASYETMEGLLLRDRVQESGVSFDQQTKAYASAFVYAEDRDMYIAAVDSDALLANYYRNHRVQTIEYRELLPDRTARWLRLSIELVEYPDSSDIGAYLMYEDIDKEKREALHVKEMAEHDPLTGVLNRSAFARQVDQIIQKATASGHALLMIDIDRFKQLNDSVGHAAGDRALIEIANVLRSSLRHGDLLGRLGGDEFLVFIRDVPYDPIIEKKARQICTLIREKCGTDVQLSASIGVAVYPKDGDCYEALYHNADAALYSAKDAGRDTFRFFNTAMQGHAVADANNNAVEAPILTAGKPLRRMLIVDDSDINREMLAETFRDLYSIETAADGSAALTRLKHYGTSIAIVLLDLMMPGMDGFAVLAEMRDHIETQSIPVIVVSAQEDQETSLRAIKAGAADFVTKPVDPDLIRIRVESAVSKAESERLRAQNSYLLLQNSEEAKYRTVLESTGTVVIEYDWMNGVYTYDPSISTYIAGTFDNRRLWQILLSDMVADTSDVRAMQEMVHAIANDRARLYGEKTVRLKAASGKRQWFRMRVFKRADVYQLTNKLIITFNNINDEMEAIEQLHYQAERDELTGLWNRKTFFEKTREMILAKRPGYYVMASFDIDSFKVLNDQYGSAKGDDVLKRVADVFREGFEKIGGVVSRITADNFAVLYPAAYMNSEETRRITDDVARLDGSIPPISFSIGRYLVDDFSLPVSGMYDRATLAQYSVKGRFDAHIALYDETMRDDLLHRQQLLSEMKQALEDGEFEPWFQPQYNHATGALVGAEALVRWRHPKRGLVMPGAFIPAFERSGFVYELDKYVWERVCAYLRKWLDQGRNPLPVSVNISRYDILRDDLCDVIVALVRKYQLPVSLLRLEVTESAFAKNTERIVAVVKTLISNGFTVEIDDFGSGYSSLNTLKDVPAQVLKMDMRFLETNTCSLDGSCAESTSRGGNILESVVRMAKWLGMAVIAEGVETLAQADYLKSIGCTYIQGYLYAHPMSAADYEKRAATAGKEEKLITLETVENHDNNRFWDPNSMDTLIFNTYVGGACIFEWNNERIELLRANDRYARTIGGENCSIEDVLKLDWLAHMDDAAMAATKDAIQRTIASGDDAVYEASYHDLFGDGKDTYLRTTFRVIARTTNRYLLYATNENLTAEHEAERQRLAAQRQLQTLNQNLQNMMDDMPGGFARLRVLPGNVLATEYVNDSFCRLRGMSREEILARDGKDAVGAVHPDDVERVHAAMMDMLLTDETRRMQYRLLHKSGEYVPLTVFSRVTRNDAGEPIINAYYADMSKEEKEALAFSAILPIALSTIMRSTTDLSFVKDMDFKYLSCSKAFAQMVGLDSEADIVGKTDDQLFSKEIADSYRADDLRLLEGGESLVDYLEPIPSQDELQHFSSTSKYILKDAAGKAIGLYGVGRDVTEVRTAFDRLKLLTDSIPGGLVTYALYPEGLRAVYFNDGMCKLFGCTREEYAKATKDSVITTVFPEDVPRLQKQIQRMMTEGTPVNCVYRIRGMKDGKLKWVNLRATAAEKRGGVLQANAVLFDITEQKLAEEAAHVHEEEMRFAVSQLGKTLCEYDPVDGTLTVPQSYATQYGLPTVMPNMPDSVTDTGAISEDTLSAYRGFYEDIQRGHKTGSAEFKAKRADGLWHWEKMEFSSIFDADGKPIKTVITTEETTQQHLRYELEQARPTLGEENLLVHALFNLNTGETLDYAYRDGAAVPQDERTAFLFGGDNLERIIPDDDERKRYRELNDKTKLLALYDEGKTEFSMDYRRAMFGGETLWVRNLLRMVRQPGGSDILLFEYCYNIEKEKTWELLYATLLRENYDYVARVNILNGHFELLANHENMQGLPPEKGTDLDGAAKLWNMESIHPEDRAAMLECTTAEGAKRKLASADRYQFPFRLVMPDGEIRYKKLSVYCLDRARGVVIAAREDVSDLVREEMLKNDQLMSALDAANQASRAKSQFLSRMSHELRTPMNAIIGLAALSTIEANNPKVMADSIGKIGMSARYLLSLINDILEMSRIESGKMSLNEAPFDFERLISEVSGVINAQAEEKGLDYDAVVNGYTEPAYVGDAVKLQQILINVLGNAVKFTPAGGKVTLGIEQLRRTKKGVSLRFTISDTGIGIDEQFIPHLFDMFAQESEQVTSAATGTGLGLAITKNLVDMMNGKISVKSIKGMGSVFTIVVQVGITKDSERYLDLAASMKLDKLRALVVDDDVTVCKSTQDILKKLGMHADWADSGAKAVERVWKAHAGKQEYDTVIVDWKMPDMDGIETTRRIRAIVGPEVTIIIMTAYDWSGIEAEAREAGVDLFMEKPLFQSSIVKAFERVFLKHRAETEPETPELPDFTGKRILLVEDNPLNTEVAKRMLETVGAEVTAVSNGLEAIEAFTTEPAGWFDAILMDIRMPVMDGLTATRSIRKLKKEGSKTIPIVAMTANAFDEDVEMSLSAGMNAHLTKPVEPEVLFSTLKRLLLKP